MIFLLSHLLFPLTALTADCVTPVPYRLPARALVRCLKEFHRDLTFNDELVKKLITKMKLSQDYDDTTLTQQQFRSDLETQIATGDQTQLMIELFQDDLERDLGQDFAFLNFPKQKQGQYIQQAKERYKAASSSSARNKILNTSSLNLDRKIKSSLGIPKRNPLPRYLSEVLSMSDEQLRKSPLTSGESSKVFKKIQDMPKPVRQRLLDMLEAKRIRQLEEIHRLPPGYSKSTRVPKQVRFQVPGSVATELSFFQNIFRKSNSDFIDSHWNPNIFKNCESADKKGL